MQWINVEFSAQSIDTLLWMEAVCREINFMGGDRDFIIAQINTGSHQGGERAKEFTLDWEWATIARLGILGPNGAGTAVLTLGGRILFTQAVWSMAYLHWKPRCPVAWAFLSRVRESCQDSRVRQGSWESGRRSWEKLKRTYLTFVFNDFVGFRLVGETQDLCQILSSQGLTESLSPMAEDRVLSSNVADPRGRTSLVFTVITFRYDQIHLESHAVRDEVFVFLSLKYIGKVIQNFKSLKLRSTKRKVLYNEKWSLELPFPTLISFPIGNYLPFS